MSVHNLSPCCISIPRDNIKIKCHQESSLLSCLHSFVFVNFYQLSGPSNWQSHFCRSKEEVEMTNMSQREPLTPSHRRHQSHQLQEGQSGQLNKSCSSSSKNSGNYRRKHKDKCHNCSCVLFPVLTLLTIVVMYLICNVPRLSLNTAEYIIR